MQHIAGLEVCVCVCDQYAARKTCVRVFFHASSEAKMIFKCAPDKGLSLAKGKGIEK